MIRELVTEYKLIASLKKESYKREVAPDSWKEGSKGNIVLLLGVAERWPFMELIGNTLNSLGYKIWVYDGPEFNFRQIDQAALDFEEMLVTNDLKDVRVVAHSKGGIVSRYFIRNSKEYWRVNDYTTIASPHMGSWAALVFYRKYKQMLPNSSIYSSISLSKEELEMFTCYYPRVDNHVIPKSSLVLEGAKNIEIDVIGHTRILYSDELIELLSEKF